MRGRDLNPQQHAYEARELPSCYLTPQVDMIGIEPIRIDAPRHIPHITNIVWMCVNKLLGQDSNLYSPDPGSGALPIMLPSNNGPPYGADVIIVVWNDITDRTVQRACLDMPISP